MPTCFCTVRGCLDFGGIDPISGKAKGKTVTSSVLRTHALDEQAKEAEISVHDVEEDQVEQLSSFMARTTLLDQITGPSSIIGGRLWGNHFSDLEDLPYRPDSSPLSQDRTPSASPSKIPMAALSRSREANLLSCLYDLEQEIHTFVDSEVGPGLQRVHRPSSKGSPKPFPLQNLIKKSIAFQDRLDTITFKEPNIVLCKQTITVLLHQAVKRLEEAKTLWDARLSKIAKLKCPSRGIPYDAAHHYRPVLRDADPVMQVALFMIVTCEIILGVSRRGCNFLLQMVQYIIHLTIIRAGPNISQADRKLLSDIPVDFRRAAEHFHLKPHSVVIAVCPNDDCHATYAPSTSNESLSFLYPKACTYRGLKGKECGTRLLKPRRDQGRIIYTPIKPFVKNSFKDWLAGLLSRRGFEEKMDAAWTPCHEQNSTKAEPDMSDIFDGEILQNFKGPDGRPFGPGGEEGRYVFSLCVDYFNPMGNKQAGKSYSTGMVSLVCLNLPSDMRYKPENMFLYGVIPGPREPPLDCLNHYLRFLIDEFLEFWSPGVRFSRTCQNYYGRVALCALVCLVCDLIGARKTAGFGGIGHKQICALCHCTRDLHGCTIDLHSCQRRTNQEYRDSAKRYKDARNQTERAKIFAETGIRWSELLRLPYFDPCRFVVVDAMHNLFLGLIKEHFEILGIKLNEHEDSLIAFDIDIPPTLYDSLDVRQKATMKRLLNILRAPMNAKLALKSEYDDCLKRLQGCHAATLKIACQALSICLAPSSDTPNKKKYNKFDYARAIIDWRLNQKENCANASQTFNRGCILNEDEVEIIRSDIATMTTPSWLTSVPHDLGEARHGKLKADQWRILATVYLPISLVRLWKDKPIASPGKKLLDATMALISAVIIATSHTTSSTRAALYLQHIQSYLQTMKDLLPNYNFRPNHHMALHLAEYLCLFGPVHGWWTFPFERMIGMLQRTPTNHKMGQLEEIITNSFSESANIRALLLKDVCPPAIQNCRRLFSKFTSPDIRNGALIDIASFLSDPENDPPSECHAHAATLVSESIYKALRIRFKNVVPPIRRRLTFHTQEGRTYTTCSRHQGNSSVLVQSAPPDKSPKPAQIQEILEVSSTEILYAIRYYHQADAITDPFTRYPFLQISLWSMDQGNMVIVLPKEVVSHFASVAFPLTTPDKSYLAVASLSREY